MQFNLNSRCSNKLWAIIFTTYFKDIFLLDYFNLVHLIIE